MHGVEIKTDGTFAVTKQEAWADTLGTEFLNMINIVRSNNGLSAMDTATVTVCTCERIEDAQRIAEALNGQPV